MGLIGVIDQDHVVGAMNGRTGLCAIPFMSTPDPNPGRAPRREDVVSCANPMISPGKGTN